MHSSRMSTVYCSGHRGGRVFQHALGRWVSAWEGDVCPGGCLPPWASRWVGGGGVCPWGMSATQPLPLCEQNDRRL